MNSYGSVVTGYLRLVTRSPERRCSTAKICSKSKADRRLGGEELYSSYSSLTSALDGVSRQRHVPAALYPRGRDPGTHWTGGWVGPRAGLDINRGKILCLCRGSNPDRPVVQSVVRHCTDWATGLLNRGVPIIFIMGVWELVNVLWLLGR
jgi:hypothetical protein